MSKDTREGSDENSIPILRPRQSETTTDATTEENGALSAEMERRLKEEFIKNYAEHLEDLKKKNPEEYRKAIKELQEASASKDGSGSFRPKMPGKEGSVLGSEGITSTKRLDSLEIFPISGFVVKTYDLSSREKVFINICHCKDLAKPSMKKKLDSEGKEQEGLNIPLSLGDVRSATDKKGTNCSVYDVVVHSDVVTESKTDKSGNYRHFICQLALQYVHQKHRRDLDQRYKLPKLKYKDETEKGTCHSQWIRKDKVAKIEEIVVDDDDDDKEDDKTGTKARKKKTKGAALTSCAPSSVDRKKDSKRRVATRVKTVPSYRVYELLDAEEAVKTDGNRDAKLRTDSLREIKRPSSRGKTDDWPLIRPRSTLPKGVRIEVTLSDHPVSDAHKLGVEYSADFFVLDAPGYRRLETTLPYSVLQTHDTKATYDSARGVLAVDFTIDPAGGIESIEHETGPDAGSRPWLLARALREGAPEEGEGKKANNASTKKQAASGMEEEESEYAEDRFLKDDILSQHYIQQKEEAKRTKTKRAAEERKRRQNDPNVEYIDDVTEWARNQREKNGGTTSKAHEGDATEASSHDDGALCEAEEKNDREENAGSPVVVPNLPTLSVTSGRKGARASGTETTGKDSDSLEATHDFIFGLLD